MKHPVPTVGISPRESYNTEPCNVAENKDNFSPDDIFYSHVMVRSERDKVTLTFNAFLGSVEIQLDSHAEQFVDAASFIASQIAQIWQDYMETQPVCLSSAIFGPSNLSDAVPNRNTSQASTNFDEGALSEIQSK